MGSRRVLVPILAVAGLIWVGESAAQTQAELVVDVGTKPALSSNGQWVAYQLPGGGIARSPVSGGSRDTLAVDGWGPSWSWVHDLVVYEKNGAVYTVDPDTRATTQIASGFFPDDLAWSPLGDEIAFKDNGLEMLSYPGGARSQVSCSDPDQTECEGEGPTWSPDGAWIAFEDGIQILKVERSGGTAETVVDGVGDTFQPAWSPNGEWIAFGRDVGMSTSQIWVSDARGTSFGLWQATFDAEEDLSPAWSPDNSQIYFNRNGSIYRVAFSTDTPVEKGSWGRLKSRYE